MVKTSWAMISGASTGIGRATALQLAAKGFQVLAGVRSPSAADALNDAGTKLSPQLRGRLIPLMLDVTDASSITAAIERARELAGSAGLRVVINNAGIVVPGPVEYVTAAEWRHQFDVNFFGTIEFTQAALPLLRQGVINHGIYVPRLLIVSSIGGRISQPILAPYTTSKFAVSALGDSLRLELRRQGIGVTVIEPGAIATEIWGKGDTSAEQFHPQHPARRFYGPEIDGLIKAAKRTSARAIPADAAAKTMVRSILAKRPPARVLVGRDAKIGAKLRNLLPLSWFDSMLLREFSISGLPIDKPEMRESKLA